MRGGLSLNVVYFRITERNCTKHIVQEKNLRQSIYNGKKRAKEFTIFLICDRTKKGSAKPKNSKSVIVESYVVQKKGPKLKKRKIYDSIQKAADELDVSRKTIYKYLGMGKVYRKRDPDVDYIIVKEFK